MDDTQQAVQTLNRITYTFVYICIIHTLALLCYGGYTYSPKKKGANPLKLIIMSLEEIAGENASLSLIHI